MTKILHITSVHSPYDIRIYKKEVRSLIENGFDVKFIVPSNNPSELNEDHIYIKKSSNRIMRMISTNYKIYKEVMRLKPDIIHFHDPEFLPFSLLVKKKSRAKVIYDAHEDLPNAILSKSYLNIKIRKIISLISKVIENNISKRLDFIITATPFIENKFLKINKNTLCINNYPILDELFVNDNELPKSKKVCYVGGLSKIRGSKELSETSNKTDVEIHVAGNVKNLNEDHSLILHGNLDRTEVAKLMSQSIAGIVTFLPEPNHINARPNKMFEYMSAGLPVISSNFPEWKGIVENNNCGLTVDPLKSDEISKAIDYLNDNPSVALEMGMNGRKAVENEFNWSVEEKKLFNIYKKLEEI